MLSLTSSKTSLVGMTSPPWAKINGMTNIIIMIDVAVMQHKPIEWTNHSVLFPLCYFPTFKTKLILEKHTAPSLDSSISSRERFKRLSCRQPPCLLHSSVKLTFFFMLANLCPRLVRGNPCFISVSTILFV